MGKEILTFGDIEIVWKCCCIKVHYKSPTYLFVYLFIYLFEDVDFQRVVVSRKISAGEKSYKCFIGYLYDDN